MNILLEQKTGTSAQRPIYRACVVVSMILDKKYPPCIAARADNMIKAFT